MRQLLVLASVVLAAACAHVDTGQADYRVAEKPTDVAVAKAGDPAGLAETKQCSRPGETFCDPLLPTRVVRRYMPPFEGGWDGFKVGEKFAINLEQGAVGNKTLEGKLFGREWGRKAEIAILANVFEFGGTADDSRLRRFLEGPELSASDDPSDIELKLIYFNDDVRRHQTFNFSNPPVLARSEYKGGSIGIQIVVMEVDAESGPMSSLLKTLARFGQQALPGPSEAKDLLFDLGESLLSGNQDDKLFEYRFVLFASTDDPRAKQAVFSPGRYVLRRVQDRTTDVDWAKIRLDNNTARLFKMNAAGVYEEERDDLYLVLNIQRYSKDTLSEFYTPLDYDDFRKKVQAIANAKEAPLDKVTADVLGLIQKSRSAEWGSGLLKGWQDLRTNLDVYTIRYDEKLDTAPFVDVSGCKYTLDQLRERRDLAEREATDRIAAFRSEFATAQGAKSKDAAGNMVDEFRLADREKLVSAVAAYFMPWKAAGVNRANYENAAKFEAAFIGATATGDLTEDALKTARLKVAGSKDCAALAAR